MKKILNNFKGMIMLVIFLITTLLVNAQTRTASVSGNWNSTTTWGGLSVPTSANDVVIPAPFTVTVTASEACASLIINNSVNDNSIFGTLTFTSSGILGVSGNITIGGVGNRKGALDMSNAGILRIGGAFTLGNSTFTAGTGTIDYNAAGPQTITAVPGFQAYNNLTLSNSGAKTIAASTVATVNGTLSRQGSATLTVSGTLTYGGSSTLEYKGSGLQTTGAEFPATGVVNLRIDNTNGVSLAGGKTISGALTLTNGVITTTSTDLLTIAAGGSTSGGSNTSFVNGPMAKVGTTAFTFPVGKTGAGIRAISISAPSTSSTFQAEFNRATAPNRGAVSGGLTQVSACEHWILDRPSGTGTAAVTLSWSSSSPCNGALYVTNLSDLKVARYTGTQWTNEGNASFGGDNANGTITSNTVTTFSPFALASSNSASNPLPVKFTDVKAFEKGNAIQIEWTNQTESDMINYLVERSLNGNDFSIINIVDARSNLSSKESYISMDGAPSTGVNYYRIKAVEVSGKIVYSNTVKVVKGAKQQELLVYPNPVTGNDIAINFTAPKGTYNVNLFNAAGQQVMKQQLNHPGGTIAQTIGLPFNSKSGMYNLQIVGDNYRANKMLIVQK